jgi:hypothetical protein
VNRRKKPKREQGQRCSLMPGECFTTRAAANEMRLTRQTNVAIGGMGQVNYEVRKCTCGRYHVSTTQHFTEWIARTDGHNS